MNRCLGLSLLGLVVLGCCTCTPDEIASGIGALRSCEELGWEDCIVETTGEHERHTFEHELTQLAVILTDKAGRSSAGQLVLAGLSAPIFELDRGSVFVNAQNTSGNSNQRLALRSLGWLRFAFRTSYVMLGTVGTSYHVEIEPDDSDTVYWTAFEGCVYLTRRDETPWPDGTEVVEVSAGETYMTVGNAQPVKQPDKSNDERNSILEEVNSTAGPDVTRNVPFVEGMTVAEASNMLEQAGLVAVPGDLSDDDIVTDSEPPGGHALDPGTEVTLE